MKITNCEALKFTVFSKLTSHLLSKLVLPNKSNFDCETIGSGYQKETTMIWCQKEATLIGCQKEAILSDCQNIANLSGCERRSYYDWMPQKLL
jgi:hypothetical protein